MATRIERRLLLVLGLILPAGCGATDRCTVSGTVLVDEVPAEGVYVLLQADGPASGQPEPGSARSAQDGSFSLGLAAPGEWKINVVWPKVTEKDGETTEGADRFEGRHSKPQWPVTKVTVREGENALPPIKLSLSPTSKKDPRPRG